MDFGLPQRFAWGHRREKNKLLQGHPDGHNVIKLSRCGVHHDARFQPCRPPVHTALLPRPSCILHRSHEPDRPRYLRTSRRVGYSFCSRDQTSVSGLPPSTISVPRPAMLVAMKRPASTCLSNNLGFSPMVFRVQNFVLHTSLCEKF